MVLPESRIEVARMIPNQSAKSRTRSRPKTRGIRQRLYLCDHLRKVAQILNTISSTNFLGQVKFSESYYYTFAL